MESNNSMAMFPRENASASMAHDGIFHLVFDSMSGASKEAEETYMIKRKLIAEAEDMSTKEKIEALDKNSNQWNRKRWMNVVAFIAVVLVIENHRVGKAFKS